MKVLAIDSSGLTASIALVDEDVTIASYTINYKKTHSQTILPMLDEIVKMTETVLNDIDGIVVSGGPGSFTGIRIGSTTAKSLGLALNKPIISVPTVDGLAYQVHGFNGLICPIMDARRGQVYTGLYTFINNDESIDFKVIKEQCVLTINELISILNNQESAVMFLGDGVPVHRGLLDQELSIPCFYAPTYLNRQNAAALGPLGIKYLKEGRTETALEHKPNYLRISQAERERAELARASHMIIREVTSEDLAKIAELEADIFSDSWSVNSIYETFTQPHILSIVAEKAKNISGYMFVALLGEDAEILNLAVAKEMQGQGIGKRLISELEEICIDRGIGRLILEVRESNKRAGDFYRQWGFTKDGVRVDYYDAPKEDAILMSKNI